jgi:hypothetical protein
MTQQELVKVRDVIEKTLADYYRKKASIFYNVVNKK